MAVTVGRRRDRVGVVVVVVVVVLAVLVIAWVVFGGTPASIPRGG